jgi:hypothetical protein
MVSSNTLLTPTIIAKEALMQLTNNLGMSQHVYRSYKNEFRKVGETITIRKPNKFRVTKAQSRTNTNLSEPSTTLTVSTQAHVSWAFSSVELTQNIEQYSARYITPAAQALANQVDADLCGLYVDVYNYAGTPGTTPATFKVLGDCQTILDNESAPQEMRYAMLNPAAHWTLADGLKGTFAAKPALDLHTKGYLGTVANLSLYMDQNIKTHTTGAFTTSATPLVDATAPATGATTFSTDGWNASSSTVTAGDLFTVATVNQVNNMSGVSTGNLHRWVCTANTTSSGGNMATLAISPTITFAGSGNLAYDNVDALPVDGDAMTFVGTESTAYAQNLVFHPNAFCLVTLPLEMPANVWGSRQTDKDAGVSIRVVKQYDIDADEEIIRMDILYGIKTLYPELAVRLWGE